MAAGLHETSIKMTLVIQPLHIPPYLRATTSTTHCLARWCGLRLSEPRQDGLLFMEDFIIYSPILKPLCRPRAGSNSGQWAVKRNDYRWATGPTCSWGGLKHHPTTPPHPTIEGLKHHPTFQGLENKTSIHWFMVKISALFWLIE